jgi:RHS repeat-associated protein
MQLKSFANPLIPGNLAQSSYSPFGSVMLGRDFRGEKYRFGFNGKEKNSELNSDNYDFGARIYDGRLGRWFSVDPLQSKYPSWSTFNFTMDNPILYIDPDGKVVTVKDVASFKAILGTLTADEINRINVNKDGIISIIGKDAGSVNLQNLKILVDSKTNHNIITSNTYESADGKVTLPDNTFGRTLFTKSDNKKSPKKLTSPDDDVYVILKPNTDEGLVAVVAHEAFGHAVLGEKKRKGEKVIPNHVRGLNNKEMNEDFKKQGWKAVALAQDNFKKNSKNDTWRKSLDKKVIEFEATNK